MCPSGGMADASGLNPLARKGVRVRVPPRAQINTFQGRTYDVRPITVRVHKLFANFIVRHDGLEH